jgi:LmbE family N-acetylglucosaminyl deacetylase
MARLINLTAGFLLLCFMSLVVQGCQQPAPNSTTQKIQPHETVLVVVAHPDDENLMGPVLAKLSRLGHDVHVVIATDGMYGTRVTSIAEGEQLAKVRRAESTKACAKLGVPPPQFLSLSRLDTKIGTGAYLDNHKILLEKLRALLVSLEPSLVFTFGPDGEYGHSEHIVVGGALTEVLLREGWVEKFPLYYFVSKKEHVTDDEDLSYVDPRYIDAQINYTDLDEAKSFEAAKCYVSQFTPDEIEEAISILSEDKSNTLFFRQFTIDKSSDRPRTLIEED